MKKILVLSDTHRSVGAAADIIRSMPDISAILHAGDCTCDAEELRELFPKIPIYYVRGNNDWFSDAPDSLVIKIGGTTIFLTHGHNERVKHELTLSTLIKRGENCGADLIVFGHTHKAYNDPSGKIAVLNPGSITYGGTYATAEIDGGRIKTAIHKY